MSVTYISAELRRQVVTRAQSQCEYCRIHESDSFYGCEVDHIISEKHGGATDIGNLAYSCFYCNRNKGSDIASINPATRDLVGFYNPRTQLWNDHFALSDSDNVTFVARTPTGEATIRIFKINDSDRVWERLILHGSGRYPR